MPLCLHVTSVRIFFSMTVYVCIRSEEAFSSRNVSFPHQFTYLVGILFSSRGRTVCVAGGRLAADWWELCPRKLDSLSYIRSSTTILYLELNGPGARCAALEDRQQHRDDDLISMLILTGSPTCNVCWKGSFQFSFFTFLVLFCYVLIVVDIPMRFLEKTKLIPPWKKVNRFSS